jgi:hypothetical protein
MKEEVIDNLGWGSVITAWTINLLEFLETVNFHLLTTSIISILSIVYLSIKIYKEIKT